MILVVMSSRYYSNLYFIGPFLSGFNTLLISNTNQQPTQQPPTKVGGLVLRTKDPLN